MTTSPSHYTVPWVAEFFHSFPHINFTFQEISTKFDPSGASYQESLIVWAAAPVLVLVLSLIFFLVFYCCRCFRRSQRDRKPTQGKCFSWTIGVFVVISCAAVALGYYGNENVTKGIAEVVTSASNVDDSVQTIQDHSYDLETTLNTTVTENVKLLKRILNSAVINETVRTEVDKLLADVQKQVWGTIKAVTGADDDLKKIHIKKYIKVVEDNEYWRWMITICVCSWTLAICLLWFIAVGKASKGILFVCAVFGMLTLTICWCAGGVHGGVAVGLGDLCVDPNNFIEEMVAKDNLLKKDILVYYMACNGTAAPFSKKIQEGTAGLISVSKDMNTINTLASPFVEKSKLGHIIEDLSTGLTTSIELLSDIGGLASCINIHKDYVDALNGVCVLGLSGVAFLLLSFIVAGVCFLLMLILAPFAWRKMGTRRRFVEVDEDDPFLPRHGASNSGVANNSPGYYRFSEPGGEAAPLGRRTPPPAYGEHAESRTLANRNTFSRTSDVF